MITVGEFFDWINSDILALPAVVFFFSTSIILSFKTNFVQIWGFPRFMHLIIHGVKKTKIERSGTMSAFHALFTAMATTIGMGNIVTPSLAIMLGGPGALFWLVFYMLFGSVTKFCEVTFALATRKELSDGFILGGPIQYLKTVSNFLANWYGYCIVIVLMSWSGAQANTLASIGALEGVPQWIVGVAIAFFLVIALNGGAYRVGSIASKLVPSMFLMYVTFALSILVQYPSELYNAIRLVFYHAFTPAAAFGGFLGASMMRSIREGLFRGIFISESGLGTSSIPHALADTKKPTDQGLLAMGSVFADAFLSSLSGLLVLITGLWSVGSFRSTLTYEVFKLNAPGIGQYVLLVSIILFVLTTVMGNSFNALQCVGILVNDNRVLMRLYMAVMILFVMIGAVIPMKLLWDIMDTLIIVAAVPNLTGILFLAFKRSELLRV